MTRIWKYDLEITGRQSIPMPSGAIVRFVAEQYNVLRVWVEVPDPSAPLRVRSFYIFGTGNVMPSLMGAYRYIGSAITAGGALVWHVYEDPV